MKSDGPDCSIRLTAAARALQEKDFMPYLKLRQFVAAGMTGDRDTFIRQFSHYYGLNVGGLGRDLRAAYFGLLFDYRGPSGSHATILRKLYQVPNARGHQVLAASFTTKLIAVHDETQPLYDKHVGRFFGLEIPPPSQPIETRISQFVEMLGEIRTQYKTWCTSNDMTGIIERVRRDYPGLAQVHAHRICDLLVWAFGHHLGMPRIGRRSTAYTNAR